MALLEVTNVKKIYSTRFGGNKVQALSNVTFSVEEGEYVAIMGESGSGKTTLLNIIGGLDQYTSGDLIISGRSTRDFSARDWDTYRNHSIGFVFQSYNLIPHQTVLQNVELALTLSGVSKAERKKRAVQALEKVGLGDQLHKHPSEMSGGQLQRLAIARALLLDPAFIVADEPVSALDVSVKAQILNLLMDLRETFSLTMLFISHEMTVVRHLCDQVAVMYLGTVVEQADSEELFRNLLHPYTQSLMSAIPTLDPDHKKQRIVLQGDIPSAIDLPKGCPFADRCPQCQTQCKESRPPLRDVGGGHLVACHLV